MRTPLSIPEAAWQNDIAVFFAHGTRQPGDTWAVGAQTQPDSELLGMIILTGRGQDDAANGAVKWVCDHCSASDLELVRVENFNDRYPEEQRADFSLTRFTVARSESPTVEACALPTGLPPAARPWSPGSEREPEGGVRALLSTESPLRPLCVHWILV
ncbi:hypothetical protein [Streptomyces albus]|uniref:hypothetical protein n=1 Tax=Streptomyces sp. NRRL F-5917 TaxID=1463873 RepID=UPI0004C054C1|nr:hypothetical protein [Streptomyces sp. NRRL F-5917]